MIPYIGVKSKVPYRKCVLKNFLEKGLAKCERMCYNHSYRTDVLDKNVPICGVRKLKTEEAKMRMYVSNKETEKLVENLTMSFRAEESPNRLIQSLSRLSSDHKWSTVDFLSQVGNRSDSRPLGSVH